MGAERLPAGTMTDPFTTSTSAESEETAIVYGMPKVVAESVAVDAKVPLSFVPREGK